MPVPGTPTVINSAAFMPEPCPRGVAQIRRWPRHDEEGTFVLNDHAAAPGSEGLLVGPLLMSRADRLVVAPVAELRHIADELAFRA